MKPLIDVIIASHLSTDFRLNSLKKCVESLAYQEYPANNIYLSYSYDDTLHDIALQVESDNYAYEKELRQIYPKLIIFRRNKRCRQFEHIYKVITENQLSDWICFQDDDDISLPNRLSDFANNINDSTDGYFSGMSVEYNRNDLKYIRSHNDFPCTICKSNIILPIIKYAQSFTNMNIDSGCFDSIFMTILEVKYKIIHGKKITYLYFRDGQFCKYKGGRY